MKRVFGFLVGVLTRFTALTAMLAAAFVFGSVLVTVRSQERVLDEIPRVVSVEEAVLQDTYVATRKFAGRIVAGQVSDVAFELPGEIVEIAVTEGDRVEKGAMLARQDEVQLNNRKDELVARRSEISAQLKRAENDLRRTSDLAGKGFSTEQALDQARADRDGLRAQLRQTDAAIATVEEDLADSVLAAPFAGEVVRRYVDEGTIVQAGQAVIRINETGVLEAQIGVPTTFRRRIQVGDAYELSSGDLVAEGVVTGLVSDVNTGTRTLLVILEIPKDPGFVPRDLVRLSLREEIRERGIWTPAQALNESIRGLWSVYIVEPDAEADGYGVIRRKDVEIIHIEESRIFVRGTLEPGDLMVAAGAFRFVPGQRVQFVATAMDDANASGLAFADGDAEGANVEGDRP
ncbi:MAG: efflux RND transporter periplasmic adaptor subunit [Pseudomonadota bacterium]